MTSKHDQITPPGYTKPKKISEGAFGQVLKMTHEGSGVSYAVKVLPMLKEGDKERVSREVELLTRFVHARIVGLHESIDMGGHQAIVMELGHRSLKDLMLEYEERNELIPLPLTVMILVDICEGLLWMHTHSSGSTAHGDLKPENVLLRPNNRAFLCDLGGSAPLNQQLTSTVAELGTFEYNSPERLLDSKGTATPASDVWSLGVLAYRMVTGKSLFDGMHLFQMSAALHTFDETKVPLSIDPSVREVLLKMLEPNVALRATTTALFEGGLLERMLGPDTTLSKIKNIQLMTQVSEIKSSTRDSEVKEKTIEFKIETQQLLEETKELESQLRSLQLSLERTCERNFDLEKEEKLEQLQNLLANHISPNQIDPGDNVLSTTHQLPGLLFSEADVFNKNERRHFDVAENTITRTGVDKDQKWSTTLFEEPISEGVVSAAVTILAIPETKGLSFFFGTISDSGDGLMFGIVDALSRKIKSNEKLGCTFESSIALAPKLGSLLALLPTAPRGKEQYKISAPLREGDRVVLEVDMDARPRTAVFIINGIVPLTFVSGLPPSIRIGLSMKNEGVSVQFDGMSRLKRATPLQRVREIKWYPEDLKDRKDMYMNGMRSSILTVQTQMPSLVFTDPSHFRVEDNRIASTSLATSEENGRIEPTWSSFFLSEPITEGIVAVSFTYLMQTLTSRSFFGLLDGAAPIPGEGQALGEIRDSIGIKENELSLLTSNGLAEIDLFLLFEVGDHFIVEINMDSTPRTAQFFVDGQSANAVVVDLPESVRVGFSTKNLGRHIQFDRITNLNRGNPITDHLAVVEWPTYAPPQATTSEINGTLDHTVEDGGEDADIDIDHSSEQLLPKVKDDEEPDEVSEDDMEEEEELDEEVDEDYSLDNSDDDSEDDEPTVNNPKRQLPTMKLPELLLTHQSHFAIRNNILTRTEKGINERGRTKPSTVLLSEPITKGVVSVTFVILNIVDSMDQNGFINFGLLDSTMDVPRLGRVLGNNVKHSAGLSSNKEIQMFGQAKLVVDCCNSLSKKDRVVMEVNMDSNPRTVQFFVNGKAGKCYVSGIPESVRIGFSADVMGTSLQITSIIQSTQATPLADKMREIKWTDTQQALKQRKTKPYNPIRREAEGSMPALLYRNPADFKIEGNVITCTNFGFTGLNSQFSTVMLEEIIEDTIKAITITILALPQTESVLVFL
ncbi:putative Cyclin-dependent kinase 2 [Blattamonas nauphoetae]|uniref:Cyclin-dependent kinase 2 n=1 Tax=Blattamonas nauphoetae TaxID=2049346 RepID=A0ABQ9WWD1_9EUKA|nr:putative Cyclin-dependent kinase 2 [Blattamonas nauphoetae]